METFWHDVGLFVRLVLTGWEQYAEAGVTGLLIYFGERISKKPLSWRLLKWIAISFLVFAFFNVWRDQYRATGAAKEETEAQRRKLESLTIPRLTLSIDQLAVGDFHNGSNRGAGAFLIANLTNDGAPSIAEGSVVAATGDGN